MIKDSYPTQAQFLSGQPVNISIELVNESDKVKNWRIELTVCWLNREIEKLEQEVIVSAGEESTITMQIGPQIAEYNGYGVDVNLYEEGKCTAALSTAFDVVSNWKKATRYGFLSDFHKNEQGDEEDVKWLNKLHLNLVQYYDWMYRHDDLVAEESTYVDLMDRELSLDVIKEKITLCHKYGMKAIAYGAVYAASKPFFQEHPSWALYQSNGKPYDFIDIFMIMNIAEQSPWQQHIIGEFKQAIELVDFDGIHMDTYGFPKSGISKLNGEEEVIRLEEHFPVLINRTREALEKAKEDVCLIFNNVGNWPVDTVALAEQDAIYIEVWNPYERYHHIQQILAWAQHVSQGKPVILAAYLQPFRVEESQERAQYAALLLTAVIAAHGGYHLLMGENHGVLTQGYYVDYSRMDEKFGRRIRAYYDFNVRYANLLYPASSRNVSMTHVDGDNQEYVFADFDYSTYGESDKVWTVVRESPSLKTISFINLTANSDDLWNEGKNKPTPQGNMQVKVLLDQDINTVYWATPDANMGRPQTLDYTITDSLRGKTLELTIPSLDVWGILAIEC